MFCRGTGENLVLDTGNILGKLLLALDVALAGDHDALGLGRTGAVHGLGAVADSGGTQAQVLDEAQDALTVLGGNAFPGGEELVADLADGLAVAAHQMCIRDSPSPPAFPGGFGANGGPPTGDGERVPSGGKARQRGRGGLLRVDGDALHGSGIIDTIGPPQADEPLSVALAKGHGDTAAP